MRPRGGSAVSMGAAAVVGDDQRIGAQRAGELRVPGCSTPWSPERRGLRAARRRSSQLGAEVSRSPQSSLPRCRRRAQWRGSPPPCRRQCSRRRRSVASGAVHRRVHRQHQRSVKPGGSARRNEFEIEAARPAGELEPQSGPRAGLPHQARQPVPAGTRVCALSTMCCTPRRRRQRDAESSQPRARGAARPSARPGSVRERAPEQLRRACSPRQHAARAVAASGGPGCAVGGERDLTVAPPAKRWPCRLASSVSCARP